MRLIDADALLKVVDEERKYLKARGQLGAEHILVHNFRDLIDNAPTVAVTDYDTGYQDGLETGLNDIRPKGEWIEGSNGNIKCNKCGAEIRYSYLTNNEPDLPKFCCECGADMRGEKK